MPADEFGRLPIDWVRVESLPYDPKVAPFPEIETYGHTFILDSSAPFGTKISEVYPERPALPRVWWHFHEERIVSVIAAVTGLVSYILERPWLVTVLLALTGYLFFVLLYPPRP